MLPSQQPDDKLVITFKEARKILGKKSKNLTNEELDEITKQAQTVVRIGIQEFMRSKLSEERGRVIKAGIAASKARKS